MLIFSNSTFSLPLSSFNFKEVVYENDNEPDSDFRVTAYILADKIQNIDDLKSYTFDTITDVILFSCVNFKEVVWVGENEQYLYVLLFSCS